MGYVVPALGSFVFNKWEGLLSGPFPLPHTCCCCNFALELNAPCAQVKIVSICLDFIVIALFSLIVLQFLRDFKLNKGLYRSIDTSSFRIEHKTFLRCCVINLR